MDAKLSLRRLIQEVKCMAKLKGMNICVPTILMVDVESLSIYMEEIDGKILKDFMHEKGFPGLQYSIFV